MLTRQKSIWIAFGLWAVALFAVMGGLTVETWRSHTAKSPAAIISTETAPAAASGAPHAASRMHPAARLAVQWAIAFMAIGAVGLLLHVALDLSERRGNFVAAVTHELRTPLTTLRMYSEMLEGGLVEGEEKRRQYLRTMSLEAMRLQQLVDNVLTHARLDEGRPERHAEPVALGDVIESLRPRLAERCEREGMILRTEIEDHTENAMVTVDAMALERVLLNLVDNACKYAATASERRIDLASRWDGSRLTLVVEDHGPGIPTGDAARLFRPFHQCRTGGEKVGSGIGLGLSISRRLMRGMGGDLHHDRDHTQGCRMVIELPGA